MAFSFNYFARACITQNLDKTYIPTTGEVGAVVPSIFTFNARATAANNSKAQVLAANYFLTAFASLSVGDLIFAACNDGNQLLTVTTSAAGGVTTTVLVAN